MLTLKNKKNKHLFAPHYLSKDPLQEALETSRNNYKMPNIDLQS